MGPRFWCVGGMACEHLVLGDGSVFASCHPRCGPAVLPSLLFSCGYPTAFILSVVSGRACLLGLGSADGRDL